jgi:hypothetical protein
LFHHWPCG